MRKLILSFGIVLFSLQTFAQSTGGKDKVMLNEEISAFEFLMKGGVFLIPISILFFYTIFLIVERYLYINKVSKGEANMMKNVKTALTQGNINEAINQSKNPKTSIGKVIQEGALSIGRPMPEIESNMERVANIEIANMEKKINHLGLIAGIAPTLGFIGTIAGVIKIFYSISISEDISIGNISGGLYEKMISSGSGLIVGIIAFTGYHLLNGKIDGFLVKVQKTVLEFIQILQRPEHGN